MNHSHCFLAFGATLLMLATPAMADRTLCSPAETPVFTCYTGGKIASLCAIGSNDFSHLRYVYGKPGKIELSYPADTVPARDAFRYGSLSLGVAGGSYVRFDIGGFSYSVFYVLGQIGEFDGVVVEKGGKSVRNLVCSEESSDHLTTDFFAQAALTEINIGGGFEIPQIFFRHNNSQIRRRSR